MYILSEFCVLLYHGASVYMDYIRARPKGACVYNPYTPKRCGITNIYAGELLYVVTSELENGAVVAEP